MDSDALLEVTCKLIQYNDFVNRLNLTNIALGIMQG